MGPHEADPGLHAVILLLQDSLIPIDQVQGPGIDHCHICPGCRRMGSLRQQPVILLLAADDVRHHMGHASLRGLVCRHILQPFPEESIGIHQKTCCAAENLGIPGPSHPLVTLGTVCGNIQEIPFKPPEDIVLKLVHQRVGTGKASRGFHPGMQHQGLEILCLGLTGPLQNPGIPESHKGEERMITFPSLPLADVCHLLFRRP